MENSVSLARRSTSALAKAAASNVNIQSIGDFQAEVLRTIHLLSESYGVQIRDFISKRTDKEVHLPQVYVALSKLELSGLIVSRIDGKSSVGQRGRPRRIYSLTAPGLRMLNARDQYFSMVRQWGEPYGVPEKVSTA